MKKLFEKSFVVNGVDYTVEIYYKSTRNGFYHIAYIYANGEELSSYRMTYYNRTWEAWAGQSSLKQAVERCSQQVQDDLNKVFDFN